MTSSRRQSRRDGSSLARTSIVLLFIGSGCAALIYEVVWFPLLRFVIGGSSLSLGILLASFMGGMCLGSFALPLVVPARFHPLRVYAVIEFAIAALGGTLPWWLPPLNDWYLRVADESLTGIAARCVVAALAVMPATTLMGATLPAVARWVKSTPAGFSDLGIFYAANIFGAVVGALAAGFVLLPQTDLVIASYVAAAINLLVGVSALVLARRTTYSPPDVLSVDAPLRNAPATVLVVIGLSGFAALSAEVIWTRLLALLFGPTVYTFTIILAVFLTGLGIGSALAARWVRRSMRPLRLLAIAQLTAVCLVPYANYMITRAVPFWPRPKVLESNDIVFVFLNDTLRAAVALLPSTVLWGASFPLALAAAGTGRQDSGRLVGQIGAANTLGAIVGSLLTIAVLIPGVGSQHAQQLLALTSGIAGALAFRADQRAPMERREIAASRGWMAAIGITLVAALLIVVPPRGMLGRSLQPWWWSDDFEDVFLREGRSATVVVQQKVGSYYYYLCINGKIEASNNTPDLRCERLLGHVAALLHPAPRKTLTVGLGTGTTAGCFVLYPEIQQMTICEIEPVVRDAADGYFAKENNDVVDDPRTTIHFDDARHFLATTDQRFDVITSDPINSWLRGASVLYSVEYFELCKQHLNPGGIMVQWIPLYQKDSATAKCELATFLLVFPNTTIWTSWKDSDGPEALHDMIAVAQLDPKSIDLADVDRRIRSNPRLKAVLDDSGIGTIPGLFGQFAGLGKDLQPWVAGAQINHDRSLRLEYLAGFSVWMDIADAIFREIVAYRRYPAEVLRNDDAYKDEILQRLGLPKQTK